jgi:GTP pyrophosphokinase
MATVNAQSPQPTLKDLLSAMNSRTPENQALVEKAYLFAEKAHAEHKRFSGEPYFIHLFETAKSLAELGMSAPVIAAGLLHDTIEDTEVTDADIEREFGPEILFMIQGVTKLGTYKYRGLERHTESLRRLLVATSRDVRVLIIKLMDRLHNMKTLQHVPREKQERIALETLEIYSPLADRLGMSQLKRELEDLAFPYVNPDKYKEILELRKKKRAESEKQLEKVEHELKRELAANNIRKFRMETRVKGLYSLFKKLERKDFDIEKIHDISAVRIIVPTVADCYNVLGIIHFLYRPLIGKIKDYIAVPKPNGYQSLHTTVLVDDGVTMEMQIRTEDMHRAAQFGIASHMTYKAEVNGDKKNVGDTNRVWIYQIIPSLLRLTGWSRTPAPTADSQGEKKLDVPEWLTHMATVHEKDADSDEFFDTLKTDFFSHRVFVFTPKGDVVDLPVESTPIDFAYAIHSDIGNHMSGAKVNGKLVSLDSALHNGDIVEVTTRPSSKPSKKWIDIAKTSLAKRHIRAELQSKSKT